MNKKIDKRDFVPSLEPNITVNNRSSETENKVSVFSNESKNQLVKEDYYSQTDENISKYLKKAYELGLSGEQADAYANMLEANEKNDNIIKQKLKQAEEKNDTENLSDKNSETKTDEKIINQQAHKEITKEDIEKAKNIAKQIKTDRINFYERVKQETITHLEYVNNQLNKLIEKKPKKERYTYPDDYENAVKNWEKKKAELEKKKEKLEAEINDLNKTIKQGKKDLNSYKKKSFLSKITFGLIK